MKKLLCLVFALILLGALCACGAEETQQVRYFILKEYVIQPTGDINLHENTYDEQWNLLSQELFLNGEKSSGVEYEYSDDYSHVTVNYWSNLYEPDTVEYRRSFDDEGREIKSLCYEEGEHVSTQESFYDEQGRLVKRIVTYAEGTVITTENNYDKDGNLISSGYTTGGYSLFNQYTYDSKGRELSREQYQNGNLISREDYSYDGNVRRGISYDGEGNLQGRTEYVLDKAGNVIEMSAYDVHESLQRKTYTLYAGSDGSLYGKLPEDAAE